MKALDPLRETARQDPRGPAVTGPSATRGGLVAWSWQELDARADAAAARLTEAGVGPGERVATLLPASPEFVAVLHAVPRVGAVLQPLHHRWTRPEVARSLSGHAAPSLLLAPGDTVPGLRSALPGIGTVAVEEMVGLHEGEGAPGPGAAEGGVLLRPALAPPDEDTPLAVLMTSGSTGVPRAVPLTHGNLAASAAGAAERLRLDPADRWLASLAPAHVGGLALLHRAAVVGSAVVTRPGFDPGEFIDLADRGEITHASLVPVMLRQVLELRGDAPAPRGLRCVLLGGTATPAPLLEEALARRWPVALTYGLTEASSQVATAPPDGVRRKPGSVGRPLPGVEVALLEPDPAGVGELLVRGPTVAPLPAGGGAAVRMDTRGWLHTGDLGRRDADGDLWITGRVSDRIISGGVTVDPGEVEAILRSHPDVSDVAVVGVPDERWGERVVAVVVPSDPAAPPTLEGVLAFARARMVAAKRPRELRLVATLPRNPNGKVDRTRL